MVEEVRKSGIDNTGEISWGTHICQFYRAEEDLIEILVPYFKSGLENNELCIWVIPEPLRVEDAKEALKKAIPDFSTHLEKEQIEIIPYNCLYVNNGIFNLERILNGWAEKINQALANGYSGLRMAEDTSWLERAGWSNFINYEKRMDSFVGKHRMIALCSCCLDKCSPDKIIDLVSNHQISLVRREGKWERVENAGRENAEKRLLESERRYHLLFENMLEGLAYCRMLYDDRTHPVDFIYLDTNSAFESSTCLMGVEGRRATEIIPGIRELHPELFEAYGRVALTGEPERFEIELKPLEIWLSISVYSKEKEHFVAVFDNITGRKQEEHRVRRYNAVLEGINRIFSNIVRSETEKELASTCLSVALEVTGSQIGFVGEIQTDELLHDIAISDMGWSQCLIKDKTVHSCFPGEFAACGLYGHLVDSGKSFFTNDLQPHPDNIGLPGGHPPLTSFLGVPFILEGKVMGTLAVANREGGYSCEQQEDLEAIAPAVMQAIQRKKIELERAQAEEALKEAYLNLEEKVKERTAELENAYNSLKENERRLSKAQKLAHVGSWDRNIATGELYWSDEVYRIFGFKPQELRVTYDTFLSHVHPEDRDYVIEAFKKALKECPFGIDYRIVSTDGKERAVHEEVEVVFDKKNNPVRVRGTVQDITERKEAEEKIRILANTVESSNDAIITESPDGIITSWNKGAEQVYGYSAEEIIGRPISILEPPVLAGETKKLAERIKLGDKIQQYETLRLRKDGKIIYVSITLSSVFDNNGKLTAISVISRDITKRKEAEKALANLEIVRKKEIHHRIKNNLQVISSLLDLQAEKFGNRDCIKDSEVLASFREIQDRVVSIALIHEELHEGEGTDTLNFSQYLQRLVENLFQTYRFGNPDISLNMDLEENVFFDMDIAVPLGMIINELVSNSLKHAFPGGKTGEIRIKLSREEKGKCKDSGIEGKNEECRNSFILTVSDNGAGIPENVDLENTGTLGTQLVTTLVDQVDGKLQLNRDSGTEFIIEFSVAEEQ